MQRTVVLLMAAGAFLASAVEASATIPPPTDRPTFKQGRQVMHRILDTYATGTDGRLALGGCRRHAKLWIVCRARIDRKHNVTRYRFRISTRANGWFLIGSDITTTGRRR